MPALRLFTGNSNPNLALHLSELLNIPLGKATVGHFSDGETSVEIHESVRGLEVFIVQSLCAPINDNIMELLLLVDALRRASAATITIIMPYLGYARQDKKLKNSRSPISAKVLADLLKVVKVDRALVVDIHAEHVQGFFNFPVDNICITELIVKDIVANAVENTIIISPDVGGISRALAVAKALNRPVALIDKRRSKPNAIETMQIIGEVNGAHCIIIDDIIDTAGTLCAAAQLLKDNGAKKITAYSTHGVLSGKSLVRIASSCLHEVVITSIPLRELVKDCSKIRQLSISGILARGITKLINNESIQDLNNG